MLPGEGLPPAGEAPLSRRAREAMVPLALGSLQHWGGWVGLSRVRAVEPLQDWGRLLPVAGWGTAPCWALSAAFLLVLSNFLVTVGSDRKIKFWDLRRLYEPINSIKRFLSTEVAWLLPYNGITVAQDNCYAS